MRVERATVAELPRLDALELSSGAVFGRRRAPSERFPSGPAPAPRDRLEEILLSALEHAPCFVAFSGGRDSSALLAETARVARAHGLEDPIPYTLRFGNAPRTDETEWQELVIRHLGLADWGTRQVTDELDALGPLALGVLRQHGVHWPPNIHTFQLLFEAAAGGSLVTGNGGDELFVNWAGHRQALLRRGRTLPRRDDLRPLLTPLLPAGVLARRPRFRLDWLRPEAALEVGHLFAADLKESEENWAESLEGYLSSRYLELFLGVTRAMATDTDVRLVEPFLDPGYVRAIAADAPAEGYPSRSAAMTRNFGDVLPPKVTNRGTKAMFTEVFTGPETRAFARDWDGSGLDPALVDAEALRAQWLLERPDLRTLVPLQAAWLAAAA